MRSQYSWIGIVVVLSICTSRGFGFFTASTTWSTDLADKAASSRGLVASQGKLRTRCSSDAPQTRETILDRGTKAWALAIAIGRYPPRP
eukprot:CAMPEP_0115643828 /NCGR_PEP_ID=MMETSP0272-20121206/37569_1 /TAXON_ID=71861 /ORGANISM="Scrippsiella trochoidea, Strain CCMP3099" /LENGTH=88 /DNA_ID=CAMNT_0003081243 /DNA_START=189 /DNA_END=455 /DNA_ORIENTATION=+